MEKDTTSSVSPGDVETMARQQAQVIKNHDNSYIRNTGQDEAQHRKYKKIKLGGGQAYDH
jgi:hypothetical protein